MTINVFWTIMTEIIILLLYIIYVWVKCRVNVLDVRKYVRDNIAFFLFSFVTISILIFFIINT